MGLQSTISLILSYLYPPKPGESAENPLRVLAVPGIVTLLDVSLFRTNEGQLTATICSTHALLWAWMDLKQQAQIVLQQNTSIQLESFARTCLEAASDAIERLTTDKLAQSANLSDPYESTTSSYTIQTHSTMVSGVGAQGIISGILESKQDTGRRIPFLQRPKDCWESPRLYCPDYTWAEDAYSTCQRLLRNVMKHSYMQQPPQFDTTPSRRGHAGAATNSTNNNSVNVQQTLSSSADALLLFQLLQQDLPTRLYQFQRAMEAESIVTKRLHLVKCEYRAPVRAFFEAHQTVQRAPSLELVQALTEPASNNTNSDSSKTKKSGKVNKLLETPELVQALAIEKKCEELEIELGQSIFPFSEMARILDHKHVGLALVPGILDRESDLIELQDTVRRLKCILCRKSGPETSSGIRPLLLDLQGVPREDTLESKNYFNAASARTPITTAKMEQNVKKLIQQLQLLGTLCKTRNAFCKLDQQSSTMFQPIQASSQRNYNNFSNHSSTSGGGGVGGGGGMNSNINMKSDLDLPSSILKGIDNFDSELCSCQLIDWFTLVREQGKYPINVLEQLGEQIRQAEMETSILALAENRNNNAQSLGLIRQRLELLANDRHQRLEVLKQIVEDVCLREMDLHIVIVEPDKQRVLSLSEMPSAIGFLGEPVHTLMGESLPIG